MPLEQRWQNAVPLDDHGHALIDVVLDHDFDRRGHGVRNVDESTWSVEACNAGAIWDRQSAPLQREPEIVDHQPLHAESASDDLGHGGLADTRRPTDQE